jgi:hypothetical protein
MATNAEVGLKFLVPAASRAALVAAVAGRGASKPAWQTASAPDAAHADGSEAGMRFQTQLHRLSRRVRTRGAVVEITVDEGRLLAEGAVRRLCEVGFELVSGSPVAMLALAERWRAHFGLVLDPRHKAERGARPPSRTTPRMRRPSKRWASCWTSAWTTSAAAPSASPRATRPSVTSTCTSAASASAACAAH